MGICCLKLVLLRYGDDIFSLKLFIVVLILFCLIFCEIIYNMMMYVEVKRIFRV